MYSVTYPVLSVLILAFRCNILGFENKSGSAVCNSLGQTEQKVLSLSVHNILLPDGVEHPVRGFPHSAGSTEESLSWLQQT